MATEHTAGLSPVKLRRLDKAFQDQVESGKIPGAVVMVGRHGEIALHGAYGFRDREAGKTMRPDAIFRLASMTKPLTSLAAMILVEENKLRLDAFIGDFFPALRDMKVATVTEGGQLKLSPPKRPAMILDLLRHTSGIVSGHLGNSTVKRLYTSAGVTVPSTTTRSEFIEKLASLPLEFQPGTTYAYGASIDLLGHIIEEVSGTGLDEFFRQRITDPLGMADTVFEVPPSARNRVAEPQIDPATGKRPAMRDPTTKPPRFSGSGNVMTTAQDWARFCQLLLRQGELDGNRLVSRKTVELMTTDQLPPDVLFDPDIVATWGPALPCPAYGHGFGLGFAVRTHLGRAVWHGSVGDLCWVGSSGVLFWVDPREDLFAILFTQAPMQLVPNLYVMRSLVYGALPD